MADVATTPAAPVADAVAKKPERPDEAAYKERLAQLEKDHSDSMARYNAVKAKVELAQPNKNKEVQSPTQKRRQELIAQAKEIQGKQGVGKNARSSKLEQIKNLDEQLRSRIAEQKASRTKIPYKSVEELNGEIQRLETQISSGKMLLAEERKAIDTKAGLARLRKKFTELEDSQKDIDKVKGQIKEIKDSMDDPEAKALSEQYSKIQAELDQIKAEQDGAFKNLNSLRDERTKLNAEQQEKWQAIKKHKDEYYSQKKAFQEYEREARQKVNERRKAERDRIDKERKKERAQKMLQEASDPAYLEEIRRANSLLHFFDPSLTPAEKAPLLADSGLTAQASRKVDDAGLKGTKLVSKKDREDDYLPAAKKGKKGKKGGPVEKQGFNCPPSVMDDCTFMGIEPPMSAADVPAVIEQVKAKLDNWKSDQAAQTQRNIDKAKKEIEKLEAEEAAEGSGATNGVNGDKKADDKVAGVTSGLKETSLADKE